MSLVDPIFYNHLRASFRSDMSDVSTGLSSSRDTAVYVHWNTWTVFFPIPILQTFKREYRVGNISPNHKSVRSRTVEDSVWSIGQALAAMGSPDPRLTQQGNINLHLRFQYCAYSKADPRPKWVKPIPIQVLRHISGITVAIKKPRIQAT